MSESGTRALRRDAVENRERLLAAARRVFAEHGHDAPLEEVARAAAVTRTTLYRHFPTREALAATVFEDNVAQIEAKAEEFAGRDDGVVALFDFVLESQRDNRSLAQVLSNAEFAWFTKLSNRTQRAFAPLLERGKASGIVHPDIMIEDLMLTFPMAAGAMADSDAAGRSLKHDRLVNLLHRALFRTWPASVDVDRA